MVTARQARAVALNLIETISFLILIGSIAAWCIILGE